MTLDVGASADLDVVYADCGVAATYRHGGDHSVDAAAMTEDAAFTDDAVTVVRDAKRERNLMREGRMVEGGRVFRVRSSELSSAPAADDELKIGADTWRIGDWELDGWELEYTLTCRQMN